MEDVKMYEFSNCFEVNKSYFAIHVKNNCKMKIVKVIPNDTYSAAMPEDVLLSPMDCKYFEVKLEYKKYFLFSLHLTLPTFQLLIQQAWQKPKHERLFVLVLCKLTVIW